jgi:ankyrin repeat protein
MTTGTLFDLAAADDADGLAAALKPAGDPFRIRNEAGESLFLFATFRGRPKCLALLRTLGPLPLHEAALDGDAARVEALLQAAPWAVDLLSPDGWTALHLAAFVGRDAVVLSLLKHGAAATVLGRAFEQNLPLHAAAAGRQLGGGAIAALAAATGDPDRPQKQGYSALMIAAANGFEAAVDALLAAGADRGRAAPDGKTAADFARERGFEALAQRLERR